jgi:hypothetical protein
MTALRITADQLAKIVTTVYEDGRWVPAQVWVDPFHLDHTFLRATFEEKFTPKHVDRVMAVKRQAQSTYGIDSDVTVVLYFDRVTPEWARERSVAINAVP